MRARVNNLDAWYYYGGHPWLNPSGIVPVGADLDFDRAVGTDRTLHAGRWDSGISRLQPTTSRAT